MADATVLKSQPRAESDLGSRGAVRLRKAGRIPAVVYGHKEAVAAITVDGVEFRDALRHNARTLTLEVGGKRQTAIIKEIQRDHLGMEVLHVDFVRADLSEKVKITVPLELRGDAPGIKAGGVLLQPLHVLHVECLLSARPDSIRVKIDELQIGQAIHVRELTLPEGVKATDDPEAVVVQIKTAVAEPAPVLGEGAGAEPEVLTAKKKDKAEGEE